MKKREPQMLVVLGSPHSWFGMLSAAFATGSCETELCTLPPTPDTLLFIWIFSVMPRLFSSRKHHVADPKGRLMCPDILPLPLEKGNGSGS